MKYFKFKPEGKFPLSPTFPTAQEVRFNLLLFLLWHICCQK